MPTCRAPRAIASALALLAVLAPLADPRAYAASGAGAGAADRVMYEPPVEAPVRRGFQQPACRWCPGNRGLDYDTPAGVPVRAIGPGRVTFAGRIGQDVYVTVTHPDGLRSSYAYVGTPVVGVGAAVSTGQVLARTIGPLHLGIRRGDTYLDPAPLLRTARRRPRLVPGHVLPLGRVR